MSLRSKKIDGVDVTISRCGYTGEDGVEVIIDAKMASMAMKLLLMEGSEATELIKPAGLGARDSLRLEAGMPVAFDVLCNEVKGLGLNITMEKAELEGGSIL